MGITKAQTIQGPCRRSMFGHFLGTIPDRKRRFRYTNGAPSCLLLFRCSQLCGRKDFASGWMHQDGRELNFVRSGSIIPRNIMVIRDDNALWWFIKIRIERSFGILATQRCCVSLCRWSNGRWIGQRGGNWCHM